MKLNKTHTRLKKAKISESELNILETLTKKESELNVLIKILDSFIDENITLDDTNWALKRARLDGQQSLVQTMKDIFGVK